MRNIISYVPWYAIGLFAKAAVWLVIAAAMFVAFSLAVVSIGKTHEAHGVPGGGQPGQVHMMTSLCNASGATRVAQANLKDGDEQVGNRVFTDLVRVADGPHICIELTDAMPMVVKETAYLGAKNGLHVYLVRFGPDLYSVMTSRPDRPKRLDSA